MTLTNLTTIKLLKLFTPRLQHPNERVAIQYLV